MFFEIACILFTLATWLRFREEKDLLVWSGKNTVKHTPIYKPLGKQ